MCRCFLSRPAAGSLRRDSHGRVGSRSSRFRRTALRGPGHRPEARAAAGVGFGCFRRCAPLIVALALARALPAEGQSSVPVAATAAESLPVREVTVFKDGHAFVLHEGEARVEGGEARLDGLPEAVIGTFWPYSASDGVRLVSATAAHVPVELRRAARDLGELLWANVGAEVVIQEVDGPAYPATILDVPALNAAAAAAADARTAVQPASGATDARLTAEAAAGTTLAGATAAGRTRAGATAVGTTPAGVASTAARPMGAGATGAASISAWPGAAGPLGAGATGSVGRGLSREPATPRYVVLRTFEGDKVVSIERIRDVTYKRPVVTQYVTAEERGELRLRLERGGQAATGSAKIGLVYLQRGLRWIPSYRVDLDGQGAATVRLQATLLNELRDMENVRVHLVVGVPTFKFKHTLDPMALQATATQLSQYFQEGRGQTAYAFSNSIMAQQARMGDYSAAQPAAGSDTGPDDLTEGARNEDLFVFTVEGVTLRRGEAMTLPVTEFSIPYEDIFALDMPFSPPAEIDRQARGPEQEEMLKLMRSPKVMHRVRLKNQSGSPLTTAPALLLREGRVLAQGMMTYASPGGSCDLDVTTAIDIRVTRKEREQERRPKALNWNGNDYFQVVLEGKISLANQRGTAVEVEVTRRVLGRVESASAGGTIEQSNVLEGDHAFEAARPYWWHWYNWPGWWSALNGAGSVTWRVKLAPGKSAELTYQTSYYWR